MSSECWGELISLNPQLPNIRLNQQSYTFGRGDDATAECRFTSNRLLSKVHCRVYIECVGDNEDGAVYGAFVEDLSQNGTFMDGKLIGKGRGAVPLPHGAQISMVVSGADHKDFPKDSANLAYRFHNLLEEEIRAAAAQKASPVSPLPLHQLNNPTSSKDDADSPAAFVRLLNGLPSARDLARLKVALTQQSTEWLAQWMRLDGAAALMDVVNLAVDEAARPHGGADVMGWEVALAGLKCLEHLLDRSAGWDWCLSQPRCFRILIFAMLPLPTEDTRKRAENAGGKYAMADPERDACVAVRIAAVQVLTSAALMSAAALAMILGGFSHFKNATGEKLRFERLVRAARSHIDTEFRVACLRLVTVLINAPDQRVVRVSLRVEFDGLGLMNALRAQRETETDADWIQTTDALFEEIAEDDAEQQQSEADLGDPLQVCAMLKANLRNSASYASFQRTMQHLLAVPVDGGSGVRSWIGIEDALRNVAAQPESAVKAIHDENRAQRRTNISQLAQPISNLHSLNTSLRTKLASQEERLRSPQAQHASPAISPPRNDSPSLAALDAAVQQAVFGVPLVEVASREAALQRARGQTTQEFVVPAVVKACIECLDKSGATVDGLFSTSIPRARLRALRKEADQGRVGLQNEHDAANMLTSYLKELPEPAFPFSVYNTVLATCTELPRHATRDDIGPLMQVNFHLPIAHRLLLEAVTSLFSRLVFAPGSRLGSTIVAASLIGPLLLRPPPPRAIDALSVARAVRVYLDHADVIFQTPAHGPPTLLTDTTPRGDGVPMAVGPISPLAESEHQSSLHSLVSQHSTISSASSLAEALQLGEAKPANPNEPPPPPPMPRWAVRKIRLAIGRSRRPQMKRLHWPKIPAKQVPATIWSRVQPENVTLDTARLQVLFNAQAASKIDSLAKVKKPALVHLLDIKRSNNVGIMLSQFKMPSTKVTEAIANVDLSIINIERINGLLKYCPTDEEIESFLGYDGDANMLAASERFFLELVDIPRLRPRLQCISVHLNFESEITDLEESVEVVLKAIDDVRKCDNFVAVLEVVLAIGNFMNGTNAQSCPGFKMAFLTKLADTRAVGNRMTLLHYMVQQLHAVRPASLNFLTEMESVAEASRRPVERLCQEQTALQKNLALMLKEIESAAGDDPLRTVMVPFHRGAVARAEALATRVVKLRTDFGDLAAYFGEDKVTTKSDEFFGILHMFLIMVRKAMKDNEREQEILARRAEIEARAERMSEKQGTGDATSRDKDKEKKKNTLRALYSVLLDGDAFKKRKRTTASSTTLRDLTELQALLANK